MRSPRAPRRTILRLSLCLMLSRVATGVSKVGSGLKKVTDTFVLEPFEKPFWAVSPHVMTIAGAGVLDADSEADEFYSDRVRVRVRDGDEVSVDRLLHPECGGSFSGRKVVVTLHGLESNTRSPLMRRMAAQFYDQGFEVAALSFRSCASAEDIPSKPGGYHLGYTDDLEDVVRHLAAEGAAEVHLSAFSLGANVVLKLLGSLGERALGSEYRLRGAAVSCVPYDPVVCSPLLSEDRFNTAVYSGNFLRTLKPKVLRQYEALGPEAYPADFDMDRVLASKSIGDFDDAFIAKVYGFGDKWNYYATQGALVGGWLPGIRVPVYAVNARDDPFILDLRLPTADDIGDAPICLQYTKHGGHCGYIARGPVGRDWLPMQKARFLAHASKALRSLL